MYRLKKLIHLEQEFSTKITSDQYAKKSQVCYSLLNPPPTYTHTHTNYINVFTLLHSLPYSLLNNSYPLLNVDLIIL